MVQIGSIVNKLIPGEPVVITKIQQPEERGEQWLGSLVSALPRMPVACKSGQKQVVHCDSGDNRGRTLVEAFHLLVKGGHLADEYKGSFSHRAYNCSIGFLPTLEEHHVRFRERLFHSMCHHLAQVMVIFVS